MTTQREQGRFQRAGLLASVGFFGLLCLLFGPITRDDSTPSMTPSTVGTGYLLGAGDAVRIQLHQQPELTLEARVGNTGWVSHPVLGEVQIGGMTVDAAEDAIAAALRGRAVPGVPRVSVLVVHPADGKTSASQPRDWQDARRIANKDSGLTAIPSRVQAVAESQTVGAGPIIGDPERSPQSSPFPSPPQQRRI